MTSGERPVPPFSPRTPRSPINCQIFWRKSPPSEHLDERFVIIRVSLHSETAFPSNGATLRSRPDFVSPRDAGGLVPPPWGGQAWGTRKLGDATPRSNT